MTQFYTLTMILSIFSFALASTMTPGPNNIMLLSSGLTFGYKRTLPLLVIEIGFFSNFSIVIFRRLPGMGDANAFNEKLIEKIMNHGKVFMSCFVRQCYLLAVLSFRTHLEKVDEAITIVNSDDRSSKK